MDNSIKTEDSTMIYSSVFIKYSPVLLFTAIVRTKQVRNIENIFFFTFLSLKSCRLGRFVDMLIDKVYF